MEPNLIIKIRFSEAIKAESQILNLSYQTLNPLCGSKREFCSRFLNSRPSPGSLLKAPMLSPPARGEGEDWEWAANPGFRWRCTLGYPYFAPSGAWTKRPSDPWLLTSCRNASCSSLRSQGY